MDWKGGEDQERAGEDLKLSRFGRGRGRAKRFQDIGCRFGQAGTHCAEAGANPRPTPPLMNSHFESEAKKKADV